MVSGIGNDIIEIKRVQAAIERHGQRFLDLIFTPREQVHCQKYKNPYPHYAARFAAKEAVSKALGTGLRDCVWTDFEIVNNELGKPSIILSKEFQSKFGQPKLLVSMSHCKEYATATVILI